MTALSDPNLNARLKYESGNSSIRIPVLEMKRNESVVLAIRFGDIPRTEVAELRIYFGEVLIQAIDWPEFWSVHSQHTEFRIKPISSEECDPATLFELKDAFQCVANLPNPFSINANFCLRLTKLSLTSFVAECFPVIQYELKGYKAKNIAIELPVVGAIQASILVKRTKKIGGKLFVSGDFLELELSAAQSILQFLHLSAIEFRRVESYTETQRKDFGLSRVLGKAISIEYVQTRNDLESALLVRHKSYRASGRHLIFNTWQEMEDEFDANSFILLAKIGDTVVGTLRGFVPEPNCPFQFEGSIPLPSKYRGKREDYFELSKLAILPRYQRSDVVTCLMQAMTARVMCNKAGAFCTATPQNSRKYTCSGAVKISEEHPHPINRDETYALYLYETEAFRNGDNMTLRSWDSFGRDAVKFVENWTAIKTDARAEDNSTDWTFSGRHN